jgi:hypothetical protein
VGSLVRAQHRQLAELLTQLAKDEKKAIVRSWNRRQAQVMARNQLFAQTWQKLARKHRKVYLPSRKAPKLKGDDKQRRVLNLLLSDLHFGSLLDHRENPYQYGPVEEARRIGAIFNEAAEYKTRYREYTELRIHLAGDLFQGQLHDPRDGAPLTAQAIACAEYLTQGIAFLSGHFPVVKVDFTPGNHGRNVARHQERAVHQKWDAVETMTYHDVWNGVKHLDNVKATPALANRRPFYEFKDFEETGLVTHGDTFLKVGIPSKTIYVERVRSQLNSIMVGSGKRYSVVAVGHVHIKSSIALPEGVRFITNGCLVPPDQFSQSIGSVSVMCGQQMWESTKAYPVGDERFAQVDHHTDKDPYFDKIIKPFEY